MDVDKFYDEDEIRISGEPDFPYVILHRDDGINEDGVEEDIFVIASQITYEDWLKQYARDEDLEDESFPVMASFIKRNVSLERREDSVVYIRGMADL